MVVHLGTTLGWEACYFDRPVLFLAMDDLADRQGGKDILGLPQFIHQYHNDRYMILKNFPNIVKKSTELNDTLRRALAAPAEFLAYNRTVAEATPLRSLDDIAADILRELLPEQSS